MKNFLMIFLLIWTFIHVTHVIAEIHITVELAPSLAAVAAKEGSVRILQKEENSSMGFLNPIASRQIAAEGNIFRFVLENEIRYIGITIPFRDDTRYPDAFFLINTLIEPGDSVHIYFEDRDHFTVKGNNWQKYVWYLKAQAMGFQASEKNVGFDQDPGIWLEQTYSKLQDRLGMLKKYRDRLSADAYKTIEADLIGLYNLSIYRMFRVNRFGYIFNDSTGIKAVNIYKEKLYNNRENIEDQVILEKSAFYASYLMQKTWCDREMDSFLQEKPVSDSFLDIILKKYPVGILRDNILLAYLYRDHLELNKEFYQIKDSLLVTDKYQKIAGKIWDIQQYASKVDSTIFRDKNGKEVRLTDFKGKVLYLDFWFTGCAGCVNVAKALPKIEKAFEGRDDILFISISIDADEKKWLESIQPLSENPGNSGRSYSHFVTNKTMYLYTDGKRQNISLLKNFNKVGSYPFMMAIDKKGKIITANPARPERNSGKDLIALLKDALQK